MSSFLFVLGGFRGAFYRRVGLRLAGFLVLRGFLNSRAGKSLYDFTPWRWLLIRDNQLTVGTLVNVVVLGVALCNHSETKKKNETKCKIQSCPSVRVGDLLVYSSMVSFNT